MLVPVITGPTSIIVHTNNHWRCKLLLLLLFVGWDLHLLPDMASGLLLFSFNSFCSDGHQIICPNGVRPFCLSTFTDPVKEISPILCLAVPFLRSQRSGISVDFYSKIVWPLMLNAWSTGQHNALSITSTFEFKYFLFWVIYGSGNALWPRFDTSAVGSSYRLPTLECSDGLSLIINRNGESFI